MEIYQKKSDDTETPSLKNDDGEPNRGVFGQQFDPLMFENFSNFTTKRAKMTVKE